MYVLISRFVNGVKEIDMKTEVNGSIMYYASSITFLYSSLIKLMILNQAHFKNLRIYS